VVFHCASKLLGLGHGTEREEESPGAHVFVSGQIEFQRECFIDSATVEPTGPRAVQHGVRASHRFAEIAFANYTKRTLLGSGHGLT
jgi:hypothetical protein